jgi:mannan endo-1,4-beta-mannosidase
MEEFSATADQNQTTTYENWHSTIIDSGLTGVLNW